LLWHRVELDTEQANPAVAEVLRYLVNGATHDFESLASMHYSVVTRDDGSHVIDEEGDLLDVVHDHDSVLDVIYRRVHQRAFELASLRGWVRLHGAVVDCKAGRVLVIAPSGGGKTSLSCQLLLDGVDVAADESTLIRDGIALPVARRFHLKRDLESAVPRFASFTARLPSLSDGSVRAFDPAEAGFPWTIREGRVAHVVLLERSGGASGSEPLSAVSAMPDVVAQSFPHQEATGTLLAEIATLMDRATCWRLTTGPLADSTGLITSLPAGYHHSSNTDEGVRRQ
jgi:hypothetical protein